MQVAAPRENRSPGVVHPVPLRALAALAVVVLATLAALPGVAPAQQRERERRSQQQPQRNTVVPNFPRYETRYYVIHTELTGPILAEAAIRMTAMAEEYHARTKDFSGAINRKFPFYLFADEASYLRSGGYPQTAGIFDGVKLMAIHQAESPEATWHTVQHEGFHQFASAVIGGQLPIWVNEGMAEYFGEGAWTGDGFVTGLIPPWRLKRIQRNIQDEQFMPIDDMLEFTHERWNRDFRQENYDQAWSMAHFLAHGDNGKYQAGFANFMRSLGKGLNWQTAWEQSFGDTAGFEKRWRKWWLELPERPTADLYAKAHVGTVTSFLARAVSQKQSFATIDELLKAGDAGELKAHKEDWLPPSLWQRALESAEADGKWALEKPEGKLQPQVVVTMENGTRVTGTFTLTGSRVKQVTVHVDDLPARIAQAQALIGDGKKTDARELLQDALKRLPNSPSAAEAKKLLAETR